VGARVEIERRLAAASPSETDPLTGAVRHALLAPGKRLRPLLAMLAGWELDCRDPGLIEAGIALEMAHAASLVLDDLPSMDNAAWRRGRPATHVAFGEDAAILASIALLSRAYATLSSAGNLEAETRCQLVTILTQAVGSGGLATGQLQDLRGHDRLRPVDQILRSNHLKTGSLFLAAVDMACVIARADARDHERCRQFANHFGQAYQLLDDLDDGNDAQVDGGDLGKATLVSILGHDEVRSRMMAHVAEALSTLRPGGFLSTFASELFCEADSSDRSTSAPRAVPLSMGVG
jgi:geranylgeranyl diphosphate synthase type II